MAPIRKSRVEFAKEERMEMICLRMYILCRLLTDCRNHGLEGYRFHCVTSRTSAIQRCNVNGSMVVIFLFENEQGAVVQPTRTSISEFPAG
jgi:hypothetical protein